MPALIRRALSMPDEALINGRSGIVYFEADGRCEPAFGQGICSGADTSVIRERV
jgi:hypothetical protein